MVIFLPRLNFLPSSPKHGRSQISTAVGLRRSPHATRTVVGTQRLEAVPQGLHVGVFVALELEAGRNDLGGPGDARVLWLALNMR